MQKRIAQTVSNTLRCLKNAFDDITLRLLPGARQSKYAIPMMEICGQNPYPITCLNLPVCATMMKTNSSEACWMIGILLSGHLTPSPGLDCTKRTQRRGSALGGVMGQ